MINTREDSLENKERAIKALSLLKEERKDIKLIKFYLEKDTYVYINENHERGAKQVFESFCKKLKISRN
jgi:hypothetical protein